MTGRTRLKREMGKMRIEGGGERGSGCCALQSYQWRAAPPQPGCGWKVWFQLKRDAALQIFRDPAGNEICFHSGQSWKQVSVFCCRPMSAEETKINNYA